MDIENPYRKSAPAPQRSVASGSTVGFFGRVKYLIGALILISVLGFISTHMYSNDASDYYSVKLKSLRTRYGAVIKEASKTGMRSYDDMSGVNGEPNKLHKEPIPVEESQHPMHKPEPRTEEPINAMPPRIKLTKIGTKPPVSEKNEQPQPKIPIPETLKPTLRPTYAPTKQPTMKPIKVITSITPSVKKTTEKSGIDYCKGHVDPFESQPVESFEAPKEASYKENLEWVRARDEFMNNVKKMTIGGPELRKRLSKGVEQLKEKRFDLFCKYG
jgi:hypothetical protein